MGNKKLRITFFQDRSLRGWH